MTEIQFSEIFALLAVQLRATDADEATIRAYYTALKKEPAELVALAAEQMARTAEWFPKTSEWLATVRHLERSRSDQLDSVIRKRQRYGLPPLCGLCEDTSYRPTTSGARYQACECRKTRRLEVLGVRPMPELPSGPEPSDELDPRVVSAVAVLAGRKVMP